MAALPEAGAGAGSPPPRRVPPVGSLQSNRPEEALPRGARRPPADAIPTRREGRGLRPWDGPPGGGDIARPRRYPMSGGVVL